MKLRELLAHLEELAAEGEAAGREAACLRRAVEEQSAYLRRLAEGVRALADEQAGLRAWLPGALEGLKRALAEAERSLCLLRVREAARAAVPEGARVLVVSKGDDELLALGGGRQAGHFPQGEGGGYLGYHPADGAEAVARLEALRQGGAEYLLFPGPSRWWLEHYADFRRHLDARYPRAWDDDHCVIFRLANAPAPRNGQVIETAAPQVEPTPMPQSETSPPAAGVTVPPLFPGPPAGLPAPPVTANDILSALYTPLPTAPRTPTDPANAIFTWDRQATPRRAAEPLPMPPPYLQMGAPSDWVFLFTGQHSARWIRRVMEREGIQLGEGTAAMEWGCSCAKVLRHFAPEAARCEFWGLDQASPQIAWAKENLSPPFKFLTCTAYPHLPFEDNKFSLIYGISVFTHIAHLVELWLMEFRRILAPGGYALFTIHDEHTWQQLAEKKPPEWRRWLSDEELDGGLRHDVVVLGLGGAGSWATVQTFFRTDWVLQEWGQYLDVVSIEPGTEWYQTLVVLKKPA